MPGSKSIKGLTECKDDDFVDFIEKSTCWKVNERLTPEDAFSHPFIAKAV